MEQGTLRGPNKPLPPTPTDQSPVSDMPGDDGTLLALHKVIMQSYLKSSK